MSRRDGTGPMGPVARVCTGINDVNTGGSDIGMGLGFGCRRGFGRYSADNQVNLKTQKEYLQEQKELLESRLTAIDKQLKSL